MVEEGSVGGLGRATVAGVVGAEGVAVADVVGDAERKRKNGCR